MEQEARLQEAREHIRYLEKTLTRALNAIPHQCYTCGKGFHGELGFDCRHGKYKSGNPDCLNWEWRGTETAAKYAAELNGFDICKVWNIISSFRRGCIQPIPCRVGDTVYELRGEGTKPSCEAVIRRIECDEHGWKVWYTPQDCNPNHLFSVRLEDFKSRFFLSKEEAEFMRYWRNKRS